MLDRFLRALRRSKILRDRAVSSHLCGERLRLPGIPIKDECGLDVACGTYCLELGPSLYPGAENCSNFTIRSRKQVNGGAACRARANGGQCAAFEQSNRPSRLGVKDENGGLDVGKPA